MVLLYLFSANSPFKNACQLSSHLHFTVPSSLNCIQKLSISECNHVWLFNAPLMCRCLSLSCWEFKSPFVRLITVSDTFRERNAFSLAAQRNSLHYWPLASLVTSILQFPQLPPFSCVKTANHCQVGHSSGTFSSC